MGENFKKLGFGLMRLPQKNGGNDLEQVNEMVDNFFKKGFTYFDTAYVYSGGQSEAAFKECVSKRYSRDEYQIANKMPIGTNYINSKEDMLETLNVSLERCGVDFFDYYLLHAMNKEKEEKAMRLGAWDFAFEMKKQGKVKHVGFSFHDSADVLDAILTAHPEAEFVQLQLNYYDWENADVQSRECHEIALKHNKKIIVMEPVKGGTLASLPTEAEELLKKHRPNDSSASWALRYAASLENVITVLSGMSNLEQLNDNISFMDNLEPITKEENELLLQVVDAFNRKPIIPCTDCKYCVEDCPMGINIPEVFKVMNFHKKFGVDENAPTNTWAFQNRIGGEKPSACVSCGACEAHCPQKIKIIDELETIANLYE
ncbi:MAG: aldo/keto reductase [bacterium]